MGGPRTACPTRSSSSCFDEDWDHFSILMESALAPDPGAPPHGDPEVLQRAGELHARQPVHPGRGPGAAKLLRRRRLQLGGHRIGRWRGSSPGRVDRATVSPPPIWRRRHSAVRAVQRQRPVAPRPGRRDPRAALRDAVAQPRTRTARPFRRSPVYHLLAAAGAQFGSKMGWERANVFAPAGEEPRSRVHLGQAQLAGLVGGEQQPRPEQRHPLRRDLVRQAA